MNKTVTGILLAVAAVGLYLARFRPPGTDQMGDDAIRAMEAYTALVADVRSPEGVRAVEDREPQLRRAAIDAGKAYAEKVLSTKTGRKETRERYLELSDQFLKECKRYDALLAKTHPERATK